MHLLVERADRLSTQAPERRELSPPRGIEVDTLPHGKPAPQRAL